MVSITDQQNDEGDEPLPAVVPEVRDESQAFEVVKIKKSPNSSARRYESEPQVTMIVKQEQLSILPQNYFTRQTDEAFNDMEADIAQIRKLRAGEI